MNSINAKDRLILAVDTKTVEEAEDLINQLDDNIEFFKIGISLHTLSGTTLVKKLVDRGKKVFLDLKFLDIPETVERAVGAVASLGVDFLTIHGYKHILPAAVRGKGDSNLKLMVVTVLTSMDANDYREMGFNSSVEELVINRAKNAIEAGCGGVIASGHEAKAIRSIAPKDFIIVTPGIRPAGAELQDQKRAVTPAETIKAGADYLVVGRPIIKAPNPQKAAEEILREMQTAFDCQ